MSAIGVATSVVPLVPRRSASYPLQSQPTRHHRLSSACTFIAACWPFAWSRLSSTSRRTTRFVFDWTTRARRSTLFAVVGQRSCCAAPGRRCVQRRAAERNAQRDLVIECRGYLCSSSSINARCPRRPGPSPSPLRHWRSAMLGGQRAPPSLRRGDELGGDAAEEAATSSPLRR